ncbi:hypothetical protein SMICM304S_09714 [Streptomyces microflavus]
MSARGLPESGGGREEPPGGAAHAVTLRPPQREPHDRAPGVPVAPAARSPRQRQAFHEDEPAAVLLLLLRGRSQGRSERCTHRPAVIRYGDGDALPVDGNVQEYVEIQWRKILEVVGAEGNACLELAEYGGEILLRESDNPDVVVHTTRAKASGRSSEERRKASSTTWQVRESS